MAKMKYNPRVTSSRHKCRKAHFTVPSSVRRVLMSAPLSTELRSKYNFRSILVKKDDEFRSYVGLTRPEKSRWFRCTVERSTVIHIDRITRDKVNGQTVNVGINPLKVVVKKLKLDKDRKSLLDRKAKGRGADKSMGKYTAEDVAAGASLQEID